MKNGSYGYCVSMNALIGVQRGFMQMSVLDGSIFGTLTLLQNETAFSGNVDENGRCVINGSLISLYKTILFKAEGTVTENGIELSLSTGRREHLLKGTAVQNDKP